MWEPRNPGSEEAWKESQLPARQLGLRIQSLEVSSADEFEGAFGKATKSHSEALAVTLSALFSSHQKRIASLATKWRIPRIFTRGESVDHGGGADHYGDALYGFILIDKILKGARPADLPVEQPTKFELVINLKTAKQIGVTIPANVLARADRVIK